MRPAAGSQAVLGEYRKLGFDKSAEKYENAAGSTSRAARDAQLAAVPRPDQCPTSPGADSGDACLAVTPQGDTNAPVLFSGPSGGHFPNVAASPKRSALVITNQ